MGEKKINLARFAYTLGRLQPKGQDEQSIKNFNEFATTMYTWSKNKNDRQQLFTALNLLIYYLRNDGED